MVDQTKVETSETKAAELGKKVKCTQMMTVQDTVVTRTGYSDRLYGQQV